MIKEKKRPVIIGVTGGSGSGKTTVAKAIYDRLHGNSIMIINQDTYYNDQSDMTMAERKAVNYDHPLAFDNDLMYQQLHDLRNGKSVEMPVYNYAEFNRTKETIHTELQDVIIIEGILILYDKRLRDLMDIKVYVDTDDDIRIIRRIQRDMLERGRSLDSVINQYQKTVKPMYHQFVEPTKRYADIIVPEGGQNKVAIDLLSTKVKDILVRRGHKLAD